MTEHKIRTATGKQVDVIDPHPDDIDILDIAHALSRIQRYGGHYPVPNSVAGHSVRVSDMFEVPAVKEAALLHDASEAYIGDIVRPLKHSAALKAYRAVEANLMDVIYDAFGVTIGAANMEEIHSADMIDSEFEMNAWETGDFYYVTDWHVLGFLRVWHDLTGEDQVGAYLERFHRGRT